MSADEQENVIIQSLRNGIVLHLKKPVKPDDLRDVWQFAVRFTKGKSIVRDDDVSTFHYTGTTRTLTIGGQRQIGIGQSSSGDWAITRNPRNQNKRANDDVDDGKRTKKICKRKDSKELQIEPRRRKKMKVVWTNSLHNRFLLSIRHLGYDRIVPMRILEFMNVPGLTRENVASHLQKYRLFLRRIAENYHAARILADKFMRSSFASGYPIQLMLQHAQQMYPQLYRQARQRLRQQETASALSPAPTIPLSPPNNDNNMILPAVGLSTLLLDNPPNTANIATQSLVSRVVPPVNNNRDSVFPRNRSFNNRASGMYTLAIGDPIDDNANGRVRRRSTAGNGSPGPSRVVHSGGPPVGLSQVSGGFAETNPTSVFCQNTVNYPQEPMNNGFIQTFPNQASELRVEDYASNFSDISFEEDEPSPMITETNIVAPNIGQSFGQIQQQGNELVLLQNPNGNELPITDYIPRFDKNPLQHQGNEQMAQNYGENALPYDNSFSSLINQMNIQPHGNEESFYQPEILALPSDDYNMALMNQTISLQLHGNDQQVLQNPTNDIVVAPNNVQALCAYQTPSQEPSFSENVDPFDDIDMDDLECEAKNWEKLMDNLLNDPDQAPDFEE